MPTYISLLSFTDQGIRGVRESTKRFKVSKALAKSLKGSIRDVYLTMGQYDLVWIVDFPDDQAAAKFSLAIGARGNVRTTTLRAFPEDDYRKVIAGIPKA